ncbi:major facilitator superfamily transporter [Maioricimonas rarisocia]|uniref:Major facilitator superfamily transporter n=1 Tax=Maioricimonas rarisocia TaxID=2528026 RepID=A0A517Z1Y8_9PLAN|nr:MFS transporter [Maioricimonas rarisocia]QDU36492.1 major facilitator superfamily transporter [Maioricimonas rarisocia]
MTTTAEPTGKPESETVYDRLFWLAYVANLLLVTANALTFRFAEFVSFLGGSEEITGRIVGVGILGGLVARMVLGQIIDGWGVRRTWIGASILFSLGCLLMATAEHLGVGIYAGRILYTIGLGSMFACSIAHIQARVSAFRRTEVLGALGSSGFLGMILGSQIGDILFDLLPQGGALYIMLFGMVGALGLAYLVIVAYITRNDVHQRPAETHPAHRLLFRYWPGPVVLVALMMGMGFAVTTVFLTRYTTEMGLGGLRTFFTAYALSAFIVRIMSRTWNRTVGRHRLIVMGLLGHAIGHLLLIPIAHEWQLILPAVCCGFGHALLFPCVVSLGAERFPHEYRGTGTTLTLGFVDLGQVMFAPLLGRMIDQVGFHAMFVTSAAITFGVTVFYGIATLRSADSDLNPVPMDGDDELEGAPQPVLGPAGLPSSHPEPAPPESARPEPARPEPPRPEPPRPEPPRPEPSRPEPAFACAANGGQRSGG